MWNVDHAVLRAHYVDQNCLVDLMDPNCLVVKVSLAHNQDVVWMSWLWTVTVVVVVLIVVVEHVAQP